MEWKSLREWLRWRDSLEGEMKAKVCRLEKEILSMHLKEGKALPVKEVGRVIRELGLKKEIKNVKRWYILFLYHMILKTAEVSKAPLSKVLLVYGVPNPTFAVWKKNYGGVGDADGQTC